MSDETLRMERAERAEAALAEYMRPAFCIVHAEYLEKLAKIAAEPLTNGKREAMEKLALALKVVAEVRGQIEALVSDGDVARADVKRAGQIAKLTAEQQWWIKW